MVIFRPSTFISEFSLKNGSGVGECGDVVFVSLLAEEELAVHGKVLFYGIVGDERVEVGLVGARFRAQDSPEALGFLLSGTEHPGDLDGH